MATERVQVMARMFAWGCVVLLGCGAKGAKESPDAGPRPLVWYHHADAACSEARAKHKPVLVLFAAAWDSFSHNVENETMQDARVRSALERVVLLRIDRTNTYMEEDASGDAAAEVHRAEARWRPNLSKYGTVLVLAADCATERGRAGPDDPVDIQLSVEHLAALLAHAAP